jgi:hypothetical protein
MGMNKMGCRAALTRRSLIAAIAATVGYPRPSFSLGNDPVISGAIRWDAWYERSGASISAQQSLNPSKFRYRAPIHCTASIADPIQCIGDDAIMSAEIQAAARSGLDYWAFVSYSEENPDVSSLTSAWKLYQKNPLRHLINWCMIASVSDFGSYPFSIEQAKKHAQGMLNLLGQENYQRVEVNRPLVYILWSDDDLKKYFSGSFDDFSKIIRDMRQRSIAERACDPYFVIMAGAPEHSAEIARAVGADAISNYISSFAKRNHGSFSELAIQVEAFWKHLAAMNVPIIPIAMVGWDTRPRQEHPVPWEHRAPVLDPSLQQYYSDATPAELAEHIQRALDFTRSNTIACRSKCILIYSWNECDEGGGILPTVGDPSGERLKALNTVR